MVKKYIILADSSIGFETPRQLTEINGEPLVKRTIRLLKENGIEDIIVTSHDKRFDNLGAIRYEPKFNDYDPKDPKSPWLKAFPIELMEEPVCYLFGDVYYSESAIKRIIEEDNEDILFFCSYNNRCPYYIKHHDEPLAFKVHNFKKFKYHIDLLIEAWYEDKTIRRPITWELYRSINGIDVNTHRMYKNYIAINDESCDIDDIDDIIKLTKVLGGIKMIKCEVTERFTLSRFDELKNIQRKGKDKYGELYVGDIFECSKELADYLMGSNDKDKTVVKIIEVVPEKKAFVKVDSMLEEAMIPTIEEKPKKKKRSKK